MRVFKTFVQLPMIINAMHEDIVESINLSTVETQLAQQDLDACNF